MNEREIRNLVEEVRAGTLPRRSFIQQMASVGVTAPMATMAMSAPGSGGAYQ